MAYIGQGIKNGTFAKLDTSGNTYNGSNVTFALGTQVGSPVQLLVSHDGVIQNPGTDYTLASNGTQITFTTAPASGASIFIMEISGAVGGPMNRDLNGEELILDVDGDTSITADTDDQIDFKVAGADDLKMTANAINVLSGTTLTIDSGATITNSGTANNFGTTTIGGLTDVSMDIANFTNGILIQTGSDGSAPTTGTLSTATGNVGIGHQVMQTITSGDYNVAVGHGALDALTTGQYNVAIGGDGPLGANNTGSRNIAIGNGALLQSDGENDNIAIGSDALTGAINGAEKNIAIGTEAGEAITTGDENVFIGYQAGEGVNTGANNTVMGRNAASDLASGSNNICIGAGSDVAAGDQSNGIAIGPVDAAAADFTFGNRVLGTVSNDFNSDANFSHSSDERLKKNIQSSTIGLNFIKELRPITYQWKPNNEIPNDMTGYNKINYKDTDKVIHGFIAQEVKAAIDKYGDENFSGWHVDKVDNKTQRIKKEMFIMPIVKAIQELSAKVDTLETENTALKARVTTLEG